MIAALSLLKIAGVGQEGSSREAGDGCGCFLIKFY